MKKKENNSQELSHFWNWFLKHEMNFRANTPDPGLLKQLDSHISSFNGCSWELGPGIEKPFSLTISPNGNPDLIDFVLHIVSLAPKISDWEFFPGKQRKNWDFKFNATVDNNTFCIDAINWEFVMLEYEDNMFEILVKDNIPVDIDDETARTLIDFVVVSAIGELDRIRYIEFIDRVESFENEYLKGVKQIPVLAKYNFQPQRQAGLDNVSGN